MTLAKGLLVQGKYLLQRKLSHNVDRQTWIAKDIRKEGDARVIVKFLIHHSRLRWSNIRLFEREAKVLKRLNHDRIPYCKEFFQTENSSIWFGLVQNYIAGRSLKTLMESGYRFSEDEIKYIATSILGILSYLHEAKPAVIHCDIKPSNILIGDDQQIYLVDFGVVHITDTHSKIDSDSTFTVGGTYGYTPVEQFGGRPIPASDIYALGATLIHLLTGISPANCPQINIWMKFQSQLTVSPHLINWLKMATEPDIYKRLQTAKFAIRALKKPSLIDIKSNRNKPIISRRIKVKQSSERLYIEIPKRGIKIEDSLIIFWIILIYCFTIPFGVAVLPLASLYWFSGLVPIGLMLLNALRQIEIRLDHKRVIGEWEIAGLRYRWIDRKTADYKSLNDDCLALVSPQETLWLDEEILAWLKQHQKSMSE